MKITKKLKSRHLSFLMLFACAALIAACKKNDERVPDVAVDIYVSPTEPGFTDLNAPGGWVYIVGGSRGIVVYRQSLDAFLAFDRHCPYQPSSSCGKVEVDSTNIQVTDPCCGSTFLLFDGSVVKGPATLPLKQYETSFDGTWVHIFN
ncbi:MAG: Rieske (2Fe-2S) protein [Flavobacteriales bacterium]|nr:Rieske (2Fe-2S) protein [Flavobacteriales bacterium]MCB9448418.1 Rieske (2Fe-2S) protein [Flavobacteriales bacterium]